MELQKYIDETLIEIGASFDKEKEARLRLQRVLDKYPDTTTAETWLALPMLFWWGILDSKILRSMPYDEFLKTPYWLAVSACVKAHNPWCALCTEPFAEPLEVHHRTYVHRGSEWKHLDDLTVLCRDCHEWVSQKPSNWKVVRKRLIPYV